MDSVLQREASEQTHQTVFANDLIPIFNRYADKIRVLSLDCFDTLLWRKTATPLDVFYDLQNRPTFKKIGFNALMRTGGEMNARKKKVIQHYLNEVSLKEIYSSVYPELDKETLQALEEDELAAEIDSCYAFYPMVQLIREAHSKKIKIIIVSDTYFSSKQLMQLLSQHLPSDVMKMIGAVYCSSDFGRTKGFGLLKTLTEKLFVKPEHVLHIGDNEFADYIAAKQLKMHALHFQHYNEAIHEMLRMQSVSASILDMSLRDTRPMYSPFKAFFAMHPPIETAERKIGYASLGQIMYIFSKYIGDEIEELKKLGKKPKVLFLMRDAYLPSLACQTLYGESFGKNINISRFSSYAASFRTQDDIDNYLIPIISTGRFDDILRQLLIPKDIADNILTKIKLEHDQQRAFINLLHEPKTMQVIFEQSKLYCQRLRRYLEREIDLTPGDTLVLIDLGYTGTTQKLLTPIFRDEMQVEIIGRYLISLCAPGWVTLARRGLIDGTWCDSRSMHAIVLFISLFEQMCTSNKNSVVDYDDEGTAIFTESKLSMQQHQQLQLIQSECLRFVSEANHYFTQHELAISNSTFKEIALAELGRLLYFPSEIEVCYLESFKFDMNMGTSDLYSVFDQKKGLDSLRKRGIFFSHMEKHGVGMRMNSSVEMRVAGLEMALMFFAHHRLALKFKQEDCTVRHDKIELIVLQQNLPSQIVIDAIPTYDGFYSMTLPVGNFQIAILFGKKYTWLQLISAERIKAHAYLNEKESLYSENVINKLIGNKIIDHGQYLLECQFADSLVMLPSLQQASDKESSVVRLVFRPIVLRDVTTP
jgi:FMN phosphatase YigB (HAD superfamily)